MFKKTTFLLAIFFAADAFAEKQLLWGDTHLHTNRSFDAYTNRNFTVDPNDAYRFARGIPVEHPYHKARVQLETPLDFLVVSDHAEFLDNIRHTVEVGGDTSEMSIWQKLRTWYVQYLIRDAIADNRGREFFVSLLPEPYDTAQEAVANWDLTESGLPAIRSVEDRSWSDTADAADANNIPGEFSAILGLSLIHI